MVLDYHDKTTAKKGLERKPLQKNRPRRNSTGLFALLAVAILVATFGAGVLTGWVLFKGKGVPAAAVVAQSPKVAPPPAVVQQEPTPPDAPLTFYKTLPQGGKGAIGSGLNLKKPEAPAAQHAAPAAAPAGSAAAAPGSAPAASAAPASGTPAAAAVPGKAAAQYVVQVASYRNKEEAESAQAKLSGRGVAAYVVETKVPDKGVWYRIRVGKHLSKAEAEELAAKSGKGAVVLQE